MEKRVRGFPCCVLCSIQLVAFSIGGVSYRRVPLSRWFCQLAAYARKERQHARLRISLDIIKHTV